MLINSSLTLPIVFGLQVDFFFRAAGQESFILLSVTATSYQYHLLSSSCLINYALLGRGFSTRRGKKQKDK